VRQWIVAGLGGEDDHRDRRHEFVTERSERCPTLLENLHEAVTDACAAIEHLTDDDLLTVHGIQGSEVTAMKAIHHVVEHFAWHSGQIAWFAELRAGSDHGLAFYDEARVNAARNDWDSRHGPRVRHDRSGRSRVHGTSAAPARRSDRA
jgi:uncharacterized damage-inducible protein DinB